MAFRPLFTPVEAEDWREVHALCSHPEVAYWLGAAPAYTPEEWERHFTRARPHFDRFQIAARAEGRLIGIAELLPRAAFRLRHGAQLWLAVHPDWQDQGVGQTLLGELVSAADRWLGLLRLEVEVDADNEKAIALFSHEEFAVEVQRRKGRRREGRSVDTLLMARLRPGFSPPKPPPPPSWVERRPPPPGELLLRPATPEDAPALAALHHHDSVIWGTMQLPYPPVGLWRERLEQPSPGSYKWLAELEREFVGLIYLLQSPAPHQRRRLGLFMSVHPAFQGMRIGHRMLGAALDFADQKLKARRVELGVYPDNERAVRLYEKHGFRVEGRKRCDAFRDGFYTDTLIMGRLRRSRE